MKNAIHARVDTIHAELLFLCQYLYIVVLNIILSYYRTTHFDILNLS